MGTGKDPSARDSALLKRYREICADLNLDKPSADEALSSFQRIGINYTLEGDKIHWLACALYVACRNGTLPTVGGTGETVEGNCVSLPRLLRSCKLSLVQFFNKMKKWSDMANLRHDMRNKIEHLERNFNVSTVIYKKFKPIFLSIFQSISPGVPSPIRQGKNRKQSRKQKVTPNDLFNFCWSLFVHVKSNFTAISDDLVNSYHLLLTCIDFCYSNALVADNAKELLNSNFPQLPTGFMEDAFKPPESVPCILQYLCDQWEGLYVEADGIKQHWWKPHIKRMIEKKQLKCRNNLQMLGVFDLANFESNMKCITREYDSYVLNIGDFDEKIFLSDNAEEELGTVPKDNDDDLKQLKSKMKEVKTLAPNTPLSNKHYLRNKEFVPATPVSNATQAVSRLHSILLGCKDEPSAKLVEIFEKCTVNPQALIMKCIRELSEKFIYSYIQPEDQFDTLIQPNNEFAKKRLDLGVTLYYKALEKIIIKEMKIMEKKGSSSSEMSIEEKLSSFLSHELFHVSLLACSLEIILYAYNSKRIFPWIIDVFSDYKDLHFQPFHFYKVVELLIREEENLPRDVVKYMNSIEEQILESIAWKSDSALWEAIKIVGSVPSCEDVALRQISPGSNCPIPQSPLSAVKSLNGAMPSPYTPSSDRFASPVHPSSHAKRRLFDAGPPSTSPAKEGSNISQQIVHIAVPGYNPGELRYMQTYTITVPQSPQEAKEVHKDLPKANKAGSIGLFFRKVYHLAWLRARDLCDRLNLSSEDIKKKVWTCFEYCLKNHTDLMRDRHIDQLIMCAIYAMCKVSKKDQSFQDIMKCYRCQPQYQSHVYRSVLLTNRCRRNSASSDVSRNSGSSSASQEERERIRSSSTLPIPHPSSQPPTPTRLTGTGSQFDFGDERGDLIMFYNQIYVPEMKNYIMKFQNDSNSPPLSPLPRLASNQASPFQRCLSSKHSLYISPLKNANFPPSPNRPMQYSFFRSPAKDLRAINSMMRQKAVNESEKKVVKRIFQDDVVDGENSPTKRGRTNAILQTRLQNVVCERERDYILPIVASNLEGSYALQNTN